MSKENIKNLINYLDKLEIKTFRNIKNLSSSDQKILKKFILIHKNVENLKNFKSLIKKISNEIGCSEKLLINKYNYFKKLKLI
tara:strand:+ start:631 stop:879 length:249 start_codon:yes stop_codon:yes gene_type:complete